MTGVMSGCCCGSSGPINEDNARFLLLALFIVLYLLCGAAVFSALEQPKEREAKERWAQRFEHFSQKYNLSKKDLRNFLKNYEEANVAGIRVDTIRPRWDFTGAFYFVGTVVSTIGEVYCNSKIHFLSQHAFQFESIKYNLSEPTLGKYFL
ncbi:Potassium channel subfamily K member 13 [Xenoophorus captivus]|uniref:Potassium channel subfamily K member 13 n=1 Tax=Xenoophorus captivus TaxID=1517983 RepID=A0ABV0QUL0_9TELE